jgi:hypothetical protein
MSIHYPTHCGVPVHGYQLRLYSETDSDGWLAAIGATWDAADEARRYLWDVWNPDLHTKVDLLQDGKVIETIEPRKEI